MKNPLDLIAEVSRKSDQQYGRTVEEFDALRKVARKNLREAAKVVRDVDLSVFTTGDHIIDADILVPTVKALVRAGMTVSTKEGKDGKVFLHVDATHKVTPAELVKMTSDAIG